MENVLLVCTSVNSILSQSGVIVSIGTAVACVGVQADIPNAKLNKVRAKRNNFTVSSLLSMHVAGVKFLSMFFSHVEQALNPNKDQGQQTHTDASPPRTQGAVE